MLAIDVVLAVNVVLSSVVIDVLVVDVLAPVVKRVVLELKQLK